MDHRKHKISFTRYYVYMGVKVKTQNTKNIVCCLFIILAIESASGFKR